MWDLVCTCCLAQAAIHQLLWRDGKMKRLPSKYHESVVQLVAETSGRSRFELGHDANNELMVRACRRTFLAIHSNVSDSI